MPIPRKSSIGQDAFNDGGMPSLLPIPSYSHFILIFCVAWCYSKYFSPLKVFIYTNVFKICNFKMSGLQIPRIPQPTWGTEVHSAAKFEKKTDLYYEC